MPRAYSLLIAFVPEDKHEPLQFSDDSVHVEICNNVFGEPTEFGTVLQAMSAYIQALIKDEIMKGSSDHAS
jgi:hypothetical protein